MDKNFSFDEIVRKVKATGQRTAAVDAIFVFGSTARRRIHAQSDLDVAVLFSRDLSAGGREELRRNFRDRLEEVTGLECDVLDLEEASTWLRYHILKTGRLIYERSPRHSRRFVAQSLLDYFDFQPIYERMERRLLERLKVA